MENGKQMRFTDNELRLIESTFRGNDDLLKVLRKVFLPELDPNAPLGQMVDLYFTVNPENMTDREIAVNFLARRTLVLHVEQQLLQLNSLANRETKKEGAEIDPSR